MTQYYDLKAAEMRLQAAAEVACAAALMIAPHLSPEDRLEYSSNSLTRSRESLSLAILYENMGKDDG